VVTAIAGVWLATAAISGYLRAALSPAARLFAAACGLALLVPTDAFAGAGPLNAVAAAAAAVFVALEWRRGAITPVLEKHTP
jgi:TRAP-type uncharacterized transport system fused permease subunit